MIHTDSAKVGLLCSLVFATTIGFLPAQSDAAKLYKWVDENGVVHYSDRMPPDITRDAHEELDSRGLTVREVDRAKTDEERMTEKVEKSMEEQQRRIAAEKQARERMRDQILLQTFTTERDLLMTRDDRLNAVDSIISLTTNNNKHLATQIEDTSRKVERIQNSGREVPENMSKQLDSLNEQFQKNKEYIELKQKERKELSESFAADLLRFRQLKGITPETDSAPAPDMTRTTDAPAPPKDIAKNKSGGD